MDLKVIFRIFLPTVTEYTFFSASHGTFSKIDCVLGHKASPNKHKKTEKTLGFFIRPQWNESRHQQQEKIHKIF
jgi:hypothetical protein